MDLEYYVLWGEYCENALEKRAPFREEHLSRLAKLKKEGKLITLGPTKCSRYVFGVFKEKRLDIVINLIEEDIYWKEGIWTDFKVYPWIQAF